MTEIRTENEQMHEENSLPKIMKENEQMHEESSLPEIMKENKQMHKESSSEDSKEEDSEEEYEGVPLWVLAESEVHTKSADTIYQVLRKIQQRLNKYSYDLRECERQIYVNNAYSSDHKPIVVSIGPIYRDKIKPDVMEVHKLKYLKDFAKRTKSNVAQLVRANLESFRFLAFNSFLGDRFNKWGESKGLEDVNDELIEMYILDGCFIIELFLKNDNNSRKDNDILFNSEWILCALSRDLILLDNQLPFWVLNELWEHWRLSKESDQDDGDHLKPITKLASEFIKRITPNQKLNHNHVNTGNVNQDLLGIAYHGLNWSFTDKANNDKDKKDGDDLQKKKKERKMGDDKWDMVKSATELEEFGVDFEMIETDDVFDIRFMKKGVLKIPRIRISYGTPYSIKMLLAYERTNIPNHPDQRRYLNDYLWFMNSLVKSPNDVHLLRQKGIIDNLSELPDDAALHMFLKDFYGSLMISRNNFSYVHLCMDLNLHCSHQRHAWMAKLKRDYFNSPWAVISFFAASLVLILTVAQTIFSITSYYNQS